MSAERLNVIALISGGKDSFYSLLHCIHHGHRVVALANLFPLREACELGQDDPATRFHIVHPHQPIHPLPYSASDEDIDKDLNSFMYQTVGHQVIPLYAQATGLPLYRQPILGRAVKHERDYHHHHHPLSSSSSSSSSSSPYSSSCTHASSALPDDETESMLPLLKAVKALHPDANALCSGAILSTYQRTRVESVALRLGLTPLAYLWKYPALPPPQGSVADEAQLLRDMSTAGLDARIIKVASAGLDERHLWERVTTETGVGRIKASLRKFGLAHGSSLGEGGEFETLVLDGPESLFKKRISVLEDGRQVVSEGGGSAWLMLRGAHLQDKVCGSTGDAKLVVREPAMLDGRFQSVLESLKTSTCQSLVDIGSKTSRLAGSLSSQLKSDFGIIHHAFVADSRALKASIQHETINLVQKLNSFLSSQGLEPENISTVLIILRDMSDFPKINDVYGKLCQRANPPSRVTISCGSLVPRGHNIVVYITAPFANAPISRNGLHVQSRSYWAPANIGPYSQAIETAVTVDGEPTTLRTVFIAGQIPLVPASMSLPPSSPTAVHEQAVLSLQHLWRIGSEMKVQCWNSAVAYFARQLSEDAARECANLAGRAWTLAHGSPDDDEDVTDGPDPWDLRYNSQYQSFINSDQARLSSFTVPDWSIFTLQQQNHPDSCIPPMFAVEIESLPRQSLVEWHAHAGVKGISEGSAELIRHSSLNDGQWKSWHLVLQTSGHTIVYTTLAHCGRNGQTDAVEFPALERRLRMAYGESLLKLLPEVEAADHEALDPYLAYVDMNRTVGLWTSSEISPLTRFAAVPCHSLWTSAGDRLGLVALYKMII